MNDPSSRILEQSPEFIAQRLMQKVSNQDGLPEIAAGLILLTFAGLWCLQAIFPPGSPFYKASNLALFVFMVLLFIPYFGLVWAIKKIRTRLLIAKVGYVKLKPLNRKQLGRILSVAAFAFAVAGVLAYLVGSRHAIPLLSWMLAVNGISGGFLATLAGQRMRYYVAGGLMAAIGIFLTLTGVSQNKGMTILYGFIGLFCLVSGSSTLATLLRMPIEPGE